MRLAVAVALASALLTIAPAGRADGQGAPAFVTADRVAVRYFSPDTGGPSHPRFITERALAFEARLQSLADDRTLDFQERHVRAAIDLHIARDMLAQLPLAREADVPTVARTADLLREALTARIGGADALAAAAAKDGVGAAEIDALFRRDARAALYIDRVITPVLRPSESQLRDVFHTAAHPFRSLSLDDAREGLSRWLAAERVRGAETAFSQTARARVVLTYAAREP